MHPFNKPGGIRGKRHLHSPPASLLIWDHVVRVRLRRLTMSENRDAGLKVALLTDARAKDQKRKVKVLEEEEYVRRLEQIVERDFFPDLKTLRRQSTCTPDVAAPAFTPAPSCRSIVTSDGVREPASTGDAEQPASNQSLGQFVNRYTSEDNASFEGIMCSIREREKQKLHWMHLDEKAIEDQRQEQLKLPDIEQQAIGADERTASVQTWSFKNKNTVMYYPEAAEMTEEEQRSLSSRQNSVSLENTRFAGQPFDEMEHRVAIRDAAQAQAQAKSGRIGPDGKVVTAPTVAGYSILPMTPTPAHVLADASPLMTWGQVEGTPLRLQSGTPFRVSAGTPSFRMPQTPAREELAHSLADSLARKHRSKRRQEKEQALARSKIRGSSTQDRLLRMSPAAQRLATTKLGVTRGADPKLLATYTPGQASWSASPSTPLLLANTRSSLLTPSLPDASPVPQSLTHDS